MLYVLSLLTPIIIGTIVGILTHSWIWGLVSGWVSLFLSIAFFSLLAGFLYGYPNKYSRKWGAISRKSQQSYEPSKYEILNEILLTEGKNLISKHFKHLELLGRSTNVSIDPFNPSDYEYLVSAFLGGPSHIGHFDPDRLETILIKLLQDDYERYYQAARQNIVSRHTRPPYSKGNN